MKKEERGKMLKSTVNKVISLNVNSACWGWFYQPKLPKGAERFKK